MLNGWYSVKRRFFTTHNMDIIMLFTIARSCLESPELLKAADTKAHVFDVLVACAARYQAMEAVAESLMAAVRKHKDGALAEVRYTHCYAQCHSYRYTHFCLQSNSIIR